MKVVVDTSVWSLALRRRHKELNAEEQAIGHELAELIKDGRVCLMGPIRQELLSGIRELPAFERLKDYLRAFPDMALDTVDYEEAAQASNRCRSAGVSVAPVDYLICAASMRRGFEIFTTDKDFQQYVRHLPLRLYTLKWKKSGK